MSSTLPSFPPGQMAKLDNMLSKITLKSHGHVCLSAPACLTEPHPTPPPPPRAIFCWGVVAGQKRGSIVWNGGDGAAAGASLIAAD